MIYDTDVIFYSGNKRYVPGRGYVAGVGGTAVEQRWANVTDASLITQQAVFGTLSVQAYVIRLLKPLPDDFKVSYIELSGKTEKFKVGQIRHTLKGVAYIVGETKEV